jgi:hypothetical protein
MAVLVEDVRTLMEGVRPFVEKRIDEWMVAHPDFVPPADVPLTSGFCRGIAAGVEEILREQFPDWFWSVVGGHGVESYQDHFLDDEEADRSPGGMMDAQGEWCGHFWVRGGDPDDDHVGMIVDLSADQFGYEEVVVTELNDSRYREHWWLGIDDKVRPSERAWGMQLYAMWKLDHQPELSWQSLCA